MPLLWLSLALMLGVLLAAGQPAPWYTWGAGGILSLALALFEQRLAPTFPWLITWRRACPLRLGLVLAALFIGAARYSAATAPFTPQDLAWYTGQNVVLQGTLASPPEQRSASQQMRLHVQKLKIPSENNPDWLAVEGELLVRLPPGAAWNYGDLLEVQGRLSTPPRSENFAYGQYLAGQGITALMVNPKVSLIESGRGSLFWEALYTFQAHARRTLMRLFPPDESALMTGILLGNDSDLSPVLAEAYRASGTAHIIAISGFNIAILAGLFALFSSRLIANRWLALLTALGGVTLYTLLVGGSASVVRAAIMGCLGLLGEQIGRRQAGANSLVFCAGVMTLFNPLLPWDVSFQLSFMATLGLILYGEWLESSFHRLCERYLPGGLGQRLVKPVAEYLLLTLAAQITTLPVIFYHFGRISLVSLLANALVLPPQPLIMILGGLALLVGMIFLPLGQIIAAFTYPLVLYSNRMTSLLVEIGGGEVILRSGGMIPVLLYYTLLGGLTFRKPLLNLAQHGWNAARRYPLARGGLLVLALVSALVWRQALANVPAGLRVTIINSSSGPALLLRTACGNSVLMSSGANAASVNAAIGQRLPPLQRHLDALIGLQSTPKTLPGLADTLMHYPSAIVILPANLLPEAQQLGLTPNNMIPGQSLTLCEDVSIQLLAEDEKRRAWLVEGAGMRMLFPGGFKPPEIPRIFPNVLLLADDDLKTPAWLETSPQVLLGPAGAAGTINLDRYEWLELIVIDGRLWVNGGN